MKCLKADVSSLYLVAKFLPGLEGF